MYITISILIIIVLIIISINRKFSGFVKNKTDFLSLIITIAATTKFDIGY